MRALRTGLASLVVLWLAAIAAPACTVERPSPNLVGQDVRLTLIHTSDIHSRLFPYNFVPNRFEREDGLTEGNKPFGGIARMATIAKNIRATSNRSLWLDSGDCFQGAPVFNMFKGEAELRSLTAAGMDAAVIGNHEFDLGSTNLFEQIDNWAGFDLLAANYLWEDPPNPDQRTLKDVVAPYAVYDVDGLKVGVIGMANWSSMTGIFEGGNSLGLRPLADDVVVRNYVRLLRPTVDVLILVSHLGLDEDEGLSANEVADENEALPLEGVDLILGGHLHIVTNPPKIVPNDEEGHSTVIVHSGAFAKFVGRLDVVVRVGEDNNDPARRSRVVSFAYDNIPVDSRVPDDPEVADVLWPYSIAINRDINLDGVFAFVKTGVEARPGVDPIDDAKITRNDLTGGDSQLGNLVARAMQTRTGVEAEFSITNSLGIRADFEAGSLNVEQMFNVFPFENSITVMYLSGSEVQETLDFIARKSSERGCRTQAQVAGIWFDMVCRGECPDNNPDDGIVPTACAKNVWLGENCRATPDGPIDPAAGCRPVLPAGLYRVAVNDYIARGGSGFEVLKRNSSKQDTGIPLRDALTVFLRRQDRCCTAADVAAGGRCLAIDYDRTTDPTCEVCDPATNPRCYEACDPSDDPGCIRPCKTVVERFGDVPCLRGTLEAHDGRIRPVIE